RARESRKTPRRGCAPLGGDLRQALQQFVHEKSALEAVPAGNRERRLGRRLRPARARRQERLWRVRLRWRRHARPLRQQPRRARRRRGLVARRGALLLPLDAQRRAAPALALADQRPRIEWRLVRNLAPTALTQRMPGRAILARLLRFPPADIKPVLRPRQRHIEEPSI